MERLQGKVAVVTGGASGIGRATVELFVEEGAHVILADVQDAAGGEIERRFQGRVAYRHCDVTSEADIAAAIQAAVDTYGGLDILFNNAGAGGARERIDEMTGDAWDRTQALLLRSVALGMRYAVPPMRARGGGAIVNTASIAGLQAGFGPIAYSTAKAAVIHLTKAGAAELAQFGIRVNAICPGYILTNIFAASAGIPAAAAPGVNAALAHIAPMAQPVAKPGNPRHIADACLYLASDAAAFVTGTHLVVDGGITIGPRTAWDPDTPSPIRDLLERARAKN
jgi:NAD(P)-dependent dehydrogenase (short-subunit alcohol dehydrogenase family)